MNSSSDRFDRCRAARHLERMSAGLALTKLTGPVAAAIVILAPVAAGTTERAPSCASEIGLAAAQRLADQCRDASPATRPPCNPVNPCAMLRDEIQRSCALFEATSPLPAELCAAGAVR